MAIDGYLPVTMNEGQQVCNADLRQMIQNMNALVDSIGQSSDTVTCLPIDVAIENGGERCVEVFSPLISSTGIKSTEIDSKLITFIYDSDVNLNFSSSDSGQNPTAHTKIVVYCGDVAIYETGFNECVSLQPSAFTADCPRDDPIRFCLEVEVNHDSTQPTVTTYTASASVCGAILCTGNRRRDLRGFVNYRNFDDACCYGRDALNMISQNIETIRSELVNGKDQTVTSFSGSVMDDSNIPLAQNIPRGATYLVTGSIKICAQNSWSQTASQTSRTLTVRPVVGCSGERTNCLEQSVSVPGKLQDQPVRTICFTVPVIKCGECGDGDTLFAGLRSYSDCETEGQFDGITDTGVRILSVEQSYCAWIFQKVDITGLPDPFIQTVGRCLTSDYSTGLVASVDTLHEYLCDRTPLEVVVIEPTLPTAIEVTPAGYDQTYVIKPAIPIVVPEDDIGPKNWTVNFTFRPRRIQRVNGDGQAGFRVTISCGNVILYQEETEWTISRQSEGFFRQYGDCLSTSECMECDPNEDFTLRIESLPGTTIGSYAGSPIRIHMYCFQ